MCEPMVVVQLAPGISEYRIFSVSDNPNGPVRVEKWLKEPDPYAEPLVSANAGYPVFWQKDSEKEFADAREAWKSIGTDLSMYW